MTGEGRMNTNRDFSLVEDTMAFRSKFMLTGLERGLRRVLGSDSLSLMKYWIGFGSADIDAIEETQMPIFRRYIGIDYSGAETADSSCRGLRVYSAEGSGTPEPVQPRKCSRRRRFRVDDCGVDCTRSSKDRPRVAALLPLA